MSAELVSRAARALKDFAARARGGRLSVEATHHASGAVLILRREDIGSLRWTIALERLERTLREDR
jgi:hypothetical protein